MKKSAQIFSVLITLLTLLSSRAGFAQLPSQVLVGYHENWNTLKISQAHANYNVICLAFALPVNAPTRGYDLRYALPAGYSSVAQVIADIDLVHSQGKTVLLSIGGATGPIMLTTAAEQTTFETSINNIFTTYGNRIDGIDMDLETSSLAFGTTWTMTAPAAAQTRMVNAIKNIMANYQTVNGKKMILTMAPEVVYLMGGLSTWQVTNANGGAFLPILDGLRNELDLIHMQLYNAGGASGGVIAWNGTTYYDTGSMDFALAMNESLIKGFTMVSGKGTFVGIPASKVAFGLPATSSSSTAGSGYVTPAKICDGVKYFRGQITKPGTVTYTMSASYPTMKGLMTWSINEDNTSINGQWNFAIGYACTVSALPVVFTDFQLQKESTAIQLIWQTASEQNADLFIIQKSDNGVDFYEAGRVSAKGNSSSLQNYSFTDGTISSATLYYRIKEVDLNGATQYTDIKSIRTTSAALSLYPNPSNDRFTIQTAQPAQVTLTTLSGAMVEQYYLDNVQQYIGEGLTPGVYILQVRMEGQPVEYLKVIKQ